MPSQAMSAPSEPEGDLNWMDVCAADDIYPATGVAALIAGEQIAIVKTRAGEFFAISNFDPFSKAFVLSRGIVGSKGEVQKIASPIYKQCFDLRTGQCLDDPSVKLPVYPVRVIDGRVCIGTLISNSNGGKR